MFNKKKTVIIEREKKLIEDELAIWSREQKLEIEEEILTYKKDFKETIENLALSCAKDTKDYEHTFHQAKETLGIEIAKLEAKRDALKEIAEQDKTAYNKMLEHKDAEILRLNTIITTFIGKDPAPITITNNK